jgi:hypothetical protein
MEVSPLTGLPGLDKFSTSEMPPPTPQKKTWVFGCLLSASLTLLESNAFGYYCNRDVY